MQQSPPKINSVLLFLREKIALLAAGKLCTTAYEMKEYKHLALLLDHKGTLEADKNNQTQEKTF